MNWTVEVLGSTSSDRDAYSANWMRAPSTVDIHNIDAKPEIDCTVEEGTWVKLKGSCTKTNWMDFVDQVGRDDEASDGEGEDDDNFVNDYEPGSDEVAAANDVVEADSADGPGALLQGDGADETATGHDGDHDLALKLAGPDLSKQQMLLDIAQKDKTVIDPPAPAPAEPGDAAAADRDNW